MHDRCRMNDVHVARRSAQQRPSMPASRLVARAADPDGGPTARGPVAVRDAERGARRTQLRAGSVRCSVNVGASE